MRSLIGSIVDTNVNNVAADSILPSPMSIPQKPSVGAQESFVGEINFETRGGKALYIKGTTTFGKDKELKLATKTTESKRTYRYEDESERVSEEEMDPK